MSELQAGLDRWIFLMRSFPSDGWDGAAEAIARHDEIVHQCEEELDDKHPNWRDQDLEGFQPRTKDPR